MSFQEYPKMLYRGEEQCIVQDAAEEKACLAEGWGVAAGSEEKGKKAKK